MLLIKYTFSRNVNVITAKLKELHTISKGANDHYSLINCLDGYHNQYGNCQTNRKTMLNKQ